VAYRSQLASLRSSFVALVESRDALVRAQTAEHRSDRAASIEEIARRITETARRIDQLVGFEAPRGAPRPSPIRIGVVVLICGAAGLAATGAYALQHPPPHEEILCTF